MTHWEILDGKHSLEERTTCQREGNLGFTRHPSEFLVGLPLHLKGVDR